MRINELLHEAIKNPVPSEGQTTVWDGNEWQLTRIGDNQLGWFWKVIGGRKRPWGNEQYFRYDEPIFNTPRYLPKKSQEIKKNPSKTNQDRSLVVPDGVVDADTAWEYLRNTNFQPLEALEHYLKSDARYAALYAINMSGKRFYSAEPFIVKDPVYANKYAKKFNLFYDPIKQQFTTSKLESHSFIRLAVLEARNTDYKENILPVLKTIKQAGGNPLIVGGYVRDSILGIDSKDMDIEVYNISSDDLISILKTFGRVDAVGASFGVIKAQINGFEYDFSLPRRENKQGKGHKGFQVEVDHTMTPKEAASRRDFTFNSVFMDPETSEIYDPYEGSKALGDKIIKHTSDAFAEDPLRVLRGMQFASRFGFKVDPETAKLCEKLKEEYKYLPAERVWGEWFKWATKSKYPSYGLEYLVDTTWISLYPELAALMGVNQEAEWHPEGDVYSHTKHVADAASSICDREGISGEEKAVILLASLCHDFGKPSTTEFFDGRIRSHGHEQAGKEPTIAFLNSIGCPQKLQERIVPLVTEHLAHLKVTSEKALRRLAVRISPATIKELLLVIEADASGRPPLPGGLSKEAQQLSALADSLNIQSEKPKPIMQGRHLLELGVAPGVNMGAQLRDMFERQLDGEFSDLASGIALWKQLYGR